MPPPFTSFGKKGARTTLVVYPAGSSFGQAAQASLQGKDTSIESMEMHILEWLEPVERTLKEILDDLGKLTSLSVKTRQHMGNLAYHLGNDRIHQPDWATDVELVNRVRAGYDEAVEEAGKKRVAKETKQREKAEGQRRERQRSKAKLAEAKQEL